MGVHDYDLAIVGEGLAPCLVSLAMRGRLPGASLTQVSTDRDVGGDQLELVLPGRLSPAFRTAIEPAVTLEWSTCLIRANNQTVVVEERVWLVDPIQVWLEVTARIAQDALHAGCAGLSVGKHEVSWAGGAIAARDVVDLRALRVERRMSEIVEARVFAELPCPVLADFDGGGGHWGYLQYVPLGFGRAFIARVGSPGPDGRPGDPGAVDIEALPTIAAMRQLDRLCAECHPA